MSETANAVGASARADLDDDMLRAMLGAAAYQGRRVARTLNLSQTEREDAEHEILLALLERRRFFDASRSPWGPFAHLIARQAAQSIADDLARERIVRFNALSLSASPDGSNLADDHLSLPDENVPTELDVLNAISVCTFVGNLPAELRLVAEAALTAEGELGEAQRSTSLSSSEFYRRLSEIRLRMLMVGLVRRPRRRPLGKKSNREGYIMSSGGSEAAASTDYPVGAKRMTG